MIINHNMNAMTAHRQMGINTGNQGKAIEKLSSGQRINRAGDDAAGLAISEKMRGQIRGLDGASRNAQDGVSLIQTAEGALNETHNILQRMRELAVQGSNDTNVAEDRDAIQKEMDALMEEIDRISTDTEFNSQKLLDGKFKDKNLQIGANEGQKVGLDIKNMNSESLGLNGVKETAGNVVRSTEQVIKIESEVQLNSDFVVSIGVEDSAGNVVAKDINLSAGMNKADIDEVLKKNGLEDVEVNFDEGKISFNKKSTEEIPGGGDGSEPSPPGEEGETQTRAAGDITFAVKDEELGSTAIDGKATEVITKNVDLKLELNGETFNVNLKAGTDVAKIADEIKKVDGLKELNVNFDNGNLTVTAGENDELTMSKSVGAVSVADYESATKSISTIDDAIKNVSSQRADLGALQNRLEHTIATNDNSAENLQAAESRIRDVDMAKEMMNLSKNNVLVQAAQSMLGQANQQPNQVLSLLR